MRPATPCCAAPRRPGRKQMRPNRPAGALRRRGVHAGAAGLQRRPGRSAGRPPAAADAGPPDVLRRYCDLGGSPRNATELVQRADRALSLAKKGGRNRTMIAGRELQATLPLGDRRDTMKPRILVVEDEPAIADTIVYALSTDGFEPDWCATGAAALEAVRQRTRRARSARCRPARHERLRTLQPAAARSIPRCRPSS